MLKFRYATPDDVQLYFQWVNDEVVRKSSFNSELITFVDHSSWFNSALNNPCNLFYLFFNEDEIPVGQVRIERKDNKAVIGISVDSSFRGRGYAMQMIKIAAEDFLSKNRDMVLHAYIKPENKASVKAFLKAGFSDLQEVSYGGIICYRLLFKYGNA